MPSRATAAAPAAPAAAPTYAVPPPILPPLLLLLEVCGAALTVASQLGDNALPLLAAPSSIKVDAVGAAILATIACGRLGADLFDLSSVVL